MKWDPHSAQPIIDHYIGRYRDQMGSSVHDGKNSFDYGLRFDINNILLIGLSEAQRSGHMYMEGVSTRYAKRMV